MVLSFWPLGLWDLLWPPQDDKEPAGPWATDISTHPPTRTANPGRARCQGHWGHPCSSHSLPGGGHIYTPLRTPKVPWRKHS